MLVEADGAKYVVVFDPLDGSSNIDASIPTGALLFCARVKPRRRSSANQRNVGLSAIWWPLRQATFMRSRASQLYRVSLQIRESCMRRSKGRS